MLEQGLHTSPLHCTCRAVRTLHIYALLHKCEPQQRSGMCMKGTICRCFCTAPGRLSLSFTAGDNRVGIIATLFLPVVGWVAFNIGGPALNQLANTGKNAARR